MALALITSTSPVAWRHVHLNGRDAFRDGGHAIDLDAIIRTLNRLDVEADQQPNSVTSSHTCLTSSYLPRLFLEKVFYRDGSIFVNKVSSSDGVHSQSPLAGE